jgi:hypothetical protein
MLTRLGSGKGVEDRLDSRLPSGAGEPQRFVVENDRLAVGMHGTRVLGVAEPGRRDRRATELGPVLEAAVVVGLACVGPELNSCGGEQLRVKVVSPHVSPTMTSGRPERSASSIGWRSVARGVAGSLLGR